MALKTVTISARIPEKDAEFISQLELNGAVTPSDKLRALIEESRRRHERQLDYKGYMSLINDLIIPVSVYVREQEHLQQMHSEMVTRILDWLPDILAFIMSSANSKKPDAEAHLLAELEDGVSDRVFRLMESILQMGVTKRSPCYNETAIRKRVGPITDLARIIENTDQEKK